MNLKGIHSSFCRYIGELRSGTSPIRRLQDLIRTQTRTQGNEDGHRLYHSLSKHTMGKISLAGGRGTLYKRDVEKVGQERQVPTGQGARKKKTRGRRWITTSVTGESKEIAEDRRSGTHIGQKQQSGYQHTDRNGAASQPGVSNEKHKRNKPPGHRTAGQARTLRNVIKT